MKDELVAMKSIRKCACRTVGKRQHGLEAGRGSLTQMTREEAGEEQGMGEKD